MCNDLGATTGLFVASGDRARIPSYDNACLSLRHTPLARRIRSALGRVPRRCLQHCVTAISRREQMDIGTTLMVSVLFSSIGIGYCIYGKRQHQVVPLCTGLALCVYPYFMSNGYATVVVGLLLTAVPWLIRL